MSHNIYLGNLPLWVTADDIRSWLESSDLVCDSVRVIRDFETQESKGYAFVEAPNAEEMEAIIRRFHRAPIDGKLLQAKQAHQRGERSSRAKTSRRRRGRRPASSTEGASSRSSDPNKQNDQPIGNLGEALQKAL